MHGDEPLISEWVEVHFVAGLPLVERAAEFNLAVAGPTIMEHEGLWLLVEGSLIEGGHDVVDLRQSPRVRGVAV